MLNRLEQKYSAITHKQMVTERGSMRKRIRQNN